MKCGANRLSAENENGDDDQSHGDEARKENVSYHNLDVVGFGIVQPLKLVHFADLFWISLDSVRTRIVFIFSIGFLLFLCSLFASIAQIRIGHVCF